MERVIEAVYQDKVIKPLEEVDLEENERIRVAIIKLGTEEGRESYPLFGAFPQLREITEREIEEGKRIWERGLEKQIRILEE